MIKFRWMINYVVIGAILFFSSGLAMAGGNLVIYNAGSPEMGNDLVQAFSNKYPDIKAEVIRQGSGELITRIKGMRSAPAVPAVTSTLTEQLVPAPTVPL